MHAVSYRIVIAKTSLDPSVKFFPNLRIDIRGFHRQFYSNLPDRGANIDESISEVVSLAELEKFTAFQSDVVGDPSRIILAMCRGLHHV